MSLTNTATIDMLRGIAERQLAAQNAWILPRENIDQVKLVHELQVHQIELEIQNHALTDTLAQVEAMRQKYQDLFEFAPVGYFSLSTSGKILELNAYAAKLLGLPLERLVGRRLRDFFKDESVRRLDKFLALALDSTQDVSAQSLALHPGKPLPRYVNLQARALVDGSSRESEIRLAMMDVSTLKMATEDVANAITRNSGFGGLQ